MTCPTFRDRDQALRDQMGPPTAQEHLRQSMRRAPQVPLHWVSWRESDPRWHLLPVESVKPSIPGWVWVVAVCLSLGAIYVIAFGV